MNTSPTTPPVVLFIEPQPFFTNRGSPFRAKATVSALVESGYEVDLLVYPLGEEICMPGVTLHRSWRPPWIRNVKIGPSWAKVVLDIFLALKALALARRKHYTIIHGIEEAVLIALVLGFWKGTPYIMDMHSCMPEQLAKRPLLGWGPFMKLAYWFERFCVRRAAGVQTVSDDISERSRRLAPHVPAVTIEDIALDSSRTVDGALTDALRKEFALEGRKVVVYTGNLAQYQGVELLVDGFGRMHALSGGDVSVRDSVLLLVGGGPEAGGRAAELRALAEKWGIAESVIFAGERPVAQMGSFMALADVLASPRMFGAHTPLKIYSYMMANKPIVATRIRSHTNVLDDSCAFLCEPNADAFAVALSVALGTGDDERAGAHKRAQCALQRVETDYSRERFVEKVGLLYKTALER